MNVKSILGSYLGHLAGYVVAAATIVSGLDPKLVPPQYAFITALAGTVVAAAHHGYSAGVNGATITAVANAATKAITTAVPALLVALVLGAGTTLIGCASVQSFLSSPTGQTIVPAGVEVAIATAEQKGVTAAQINSVSKAVLAADTSAATTVVGLTAAVNAQVAKLNLPAGDVAAFQILETAFDAYLVSKYGNNPTVAQVQADVALFVNTAIAMTGG